MRVRVQTSTALPPAAGSSSPLTLDPNRPNPFRTDTAIRFALPREGRVELEIFDVSGRLVRTLVSGRTPAGWHQMTWSGRSENGRRVADGMYFCRLRLEGGREVTRTMVILR